MNLTNELLAYGIHSHRRHDNSGKDGASEPCLPCRGGSWGGRMPNGNMRTGAQWRNMQLDDE